MPCCGYQHDRSCQPKNGDGGVNGTVPLEPSAFKEWPKSCSQLCCAFVDVLTTKRQLSWICELWRCYGQVASSQHLCVGSSFILSLSVSWSYGWNRVLHTLSIVLWSKGIKIMSCVYNRICFGASGKEYMSFALWIVCICVVLLDLCWRLRQRMYVAFMNFVYLFICGWIQFRTLGREYMSWSWWL